MSQLDLNIIDNNTYRFKSDPVAIAEEGKAVRPVTVPLPFIETAIIKLLCIHYL